MLGNKTSTIRSYLPRQDINGLNPSFNFISILFESLELKDFWENVSVTPCQCMLQRPIKC